MEQSPSELNESRLQVLSELVQRIDQIKLEHPIRIAVDGVDGAGKTALAEELRILLEHNHRPVIRAGIDSFHNHSSIRYAKGRNSPQGYYEDSFNYDLLIENLLKPLGPHGSCCYRTSVFDYRLDQEAFSEVQNASTNSVLLFDGVFLLRNELQPFWDFSIFVDVPFDISMARAVRRDRRTGKSTAKLERLYKERYIPGQMIYLNSCRPGSRADIVLHNEPLENPRIEDFLQ